MTLATTKQRIDMAGKLRRLAKEMTEGDPKTAGMLALAAKMIERQSSGQHEKIGHLMRPRNGEVHFVQDVFSIPLAVHGTLDVYMLRHD